MSRANRLKPVADITDLGSGRVMALLLGPLSATIHSGGEPRVAVVLNSEVGEYLGGFELRAREAHELSEELRKAAEVASREEEEAN